MLLFRITEFADLSGFGGTVLAGRWHSIGRPIVYTAEHAALAMLESYIQVVGASNVPADFQLLVIDVDLENGSIAPPVQLDTRDREATRAWGDAWLAAGETALARVPSVVAPYSCNVLINPAHPDAARLRIVSVTRQPWDPRMIERRSGPH